MRAQTPNRKEQDMTKTYDYEGVMVDLDTRRELARLEGKVAEAEGWVRHYTTEIAILADRAIRLEEIPDVARRRHEMVVTRTEWRMKADNAKIQIRMLLAG